MTYFLSSQKDRNLKHASSAELEWKVFKTLLHISQTDSVAPRHAYRKRWTKYSRDGAGDEKAPMWLLSVCATAHSTEPAHKKLYGRVAVVIIQQEPEHNAVRTTAKKNKTKKNNSCLPGQIPEIPIMGGDGAQWDASQKIKQTSTNKTAGRENPPFLPVISLRLHNNVHECVCEREMRFGPNSYLGQKSPELWLLIRGYSQTATCTSEWSRGHEYHEC